MISLEPDKQNELSWLTGFLRHRDAKPKLVKPSERPDFILKFDNSIVGIEITLATHKRAAGAKFTNMQISQAQRDFDIALRDEVGPEAKVVIMISHNEGVPVSRRDWALLPKLAEILRKRAATLVDLSEVGPDDDPVPRFYPANARRFGVFDLEDAKRIDLPDYMQNIAIYRDGDHATRVGGGGGGANRTLNDETVEEILRAKSMVFPGYAKCDDHWLLIVFNVLGMRRRTEMDRRSFPPSDYGTLFSKVDITRAFETPFDRVFLYDWPSKVIEVEVS